MVMVMVMAMVVVSASLKKANTRNSNPIVGDPYAISTPSPRSRKERRHREVPY